MNEVLHPDFYVFDALLAVRDDGALVNKVARRYGVCPGTVSGHVAAGGYLDLVVKRKAYRAHRVVWLLSYGRWPEHEIDHLNGVRTDNRLANLRDVPRAMNVQNRQRLNRNNSSGFSGVSFSARQGWHAQAQVAGKRFHLGFHLTAEAASVAFEKFRRAEYAGFVSL